MKKRFTDGENHWVFEGSGGRHAGQGAVPKAWVLRCGVLWVAQPFWRDGGGGAARLRNLEAENNRLKKLLAEAHLDIEALKSVVRGKR